MIEDLPERRLGDILPLSDAVQALHASRHPGRFPAHVRPEDAARFFREKLAEGATILVWREGGAALAYALFQIEERPGNPFRFAERRGKLDQISVAPEAQGRGIGSALIAEMKARLAAQGVGSWAATYWSFNEISAATMARAGAAPMVILAEGRTLP